MIQFGLTNKSGLGFVALSECEDDLIKTIIYLKFIKSVKYQRYIIIKSTT